MQVAFRDEAPQYLLAPAFGVAVGYIEEMPACT